MGIMLLKEVLNRTSKAKAFLDAERGAGRSNVHQTNLHFLVAGVAFLLLALRPSFAQGGKPLIAVFGDESRREHPYSLDARR